MEVVSILYQDVLKSVY